MHAGRQASRFSRLTSTISAPSRFASALASVKSTLTFPMACFSTSHLQSTPPQSFCECPDAYCATVPQEQKKGVQIAYRLKGHKHIILTCSQGHALRQQDAQRKANAGLQQSSNRRCQHPELTKCPISLHTCP